MYRITRYWPKILATLAALPLVLLPSSMLDARSAHGGSGGHSGGSGHHLSSHHSSSGQHSGSHSGTHNQQHHKKPPDGEHHDQHHHEDYHHDMHHEDYHHDNFYNKNVNRDVHPNGNLDRNGQPIVVPIEGNGNDNAYNQGYDPTAEQNALYNADVQQSKSQPQQTPSVNVNVEGAGQKN